jgi:hypothetical protein
MALTYAQLQTAIEQYTEVTESTFIDNIPNFVQNTETLINNTVQLPAFRKNVTGETTISFPYIDIPSDFLSVFSLAVTGYDTAGTITNLPYDYLLQKDVNYVREAYPTSSTTGQPKYYSIFSNSAMLLGPTPDKCYTLEMHYYAYPPSITVAGTSWLGDNFPSVLLWGSLVEAYVYLKGEPDMIQTYQQKFQEAMGLLKQLGDGKDRQDNFRVTQVRDQVQ